MPIRGSRLEANLDLFRSLAAAIDDANVVWNGLQRLEVVSVTLDQDRDEPQLVFESMNSTGLDLETSDLVRNYMLMGCSMAEQKTLYEDYWLPMERVLGNLSFDVFLHDWDGRYIEKARAQRPRHVRGIQTFRGRQFLAAHGTHA